MKDPWGYEELVVHARVVWVHCTYLQHTLAHFQSIRVGISCTLEKRDDCRSNCCRPVIGGIELAAERSCAHGSHHADKVAVHSMDWGPNKTLAAFWYFIMRCNESNSYLRPSRVVRPTSAFAALVLLLQAPAPAETRIMLPQIFKDGVILQHTQPVVFGYAAASEKVTVTITPRGGGAVSFPAVADAATGRWSVLVAPPKEDPLGEVTVTVSATASTTPSITLQHVSFGELLPPLPLPVCRSVTSPISILKWMIFSIQFVVLRAPSTNIRAPLARGLICNRYRQ